MTAKTNLIKSHCNECSRETTHRILKSVSNENFESSVAYTTTHQMVECCGCQFISLLRIVDASVLTESIIDQYPPPSYRKRDGIRNCTSESTPKDIVALLHEIYDALDSDNRRLATMGARAVRDIMIVDKVKDVGTFKQKLDALVSQEIVTKWQREFLESALEAGNAASHRGHCPTFIEMNLLMNIVEGILTQIYALPEAGVKLKTKTPTRKR